MVSPMTTAVTRPEERPVFVATDDRRARRLRYAAALGLAMSCAWLVALAIGTLGVGRLPDLSLPLVARGADKAPAIKDDVAAPARALAPAAAGRATSRAATTVTQRAAAVEVTQPRRPAVAAEQKPAKKVHAAKPRTTTSAAIPPSPASAPAATPKQGWARRGSTAPPGRTRQADTTPKAATPRGYARRSSTDTHTAPETPVTTPVPPGQQKKPDDLKQKS